MCGSPAACKEAGGGISGKELPLWGPGWERGLDCGLLPICKELFQCFLHHLGGAFDVSSERPRLYWTEEKRHGDKNKDPSYFSGQAFTVLLM